MKLNYQSTLIGMFLILFFFSISNAQITSNVNPYSKKAAAESMMESKNYEDAIKLWEELAQKAENQRNWSAFIEFELQKGIGLSKLRKYDEAVDLFECLIPMAESELSPDNEHLLMVYHKLGVCYHNLHNFPLALTFYQKAIEGREKVFSKYKKDILNGYFTVGYVYYQIKNYDQALNYLNKSVDLRPGATTTELVSPYRILARTHRNLGDFSQAKPYYDLLHQYYLEKYKDNVSILADFSVDLAIFYNEFGKIDIALKHANEAISGYNDLTEKTRKDSIGLANAWHIRGSAYDSKGDYLRAIDDYTKSLDINLAVYGEVHSSPSINFNNIGVSYLNLECYADAEQFLQAALDIKFQLDNPAALGSVLNNLGDLYMAKGAFQEAADCYHQSVCYSSPFCECSESYQYNFSEQDLVSGDRKWIILSLAGKGKALRALFHQTKDIEDLQRSFAAYQLATELIDQLRLSYQTDHSKEFLTEKTKLLYEDAMKVSLDLYRWTNKRSYVEMAFTYVEKSKSIILLEAVLKSDEFLFSQVDEGLRQRERQLKMGISVSEQQLGEAKALGDSLQIRQLADALVSQNRAYQVLLDSIHNAAPAYYNLLLNASTISLKNVQRQMLKSKQAMLSYFVGEDSLYVFVAKKRRVFVKQLPLDYSLKTSIKLMNEGIYAYHGKAKNCPQEEREKLQLQYADYAYELYQKLFQPLEKYDLPRELLIIPDGVLGYLSFEALLRAPVSQPGRFHQYPYLIKQHQIYYAHSATVLQELKERKQDRSPSKMLAIAPTFDGYITTPDGGVLTPLYFNRKEVKNIARLFDSQPLIGDSATKSMFLDLAGDFQIIHISSHGEASDINTDKASYIVFAHRTKELDPDQVLYLWELYNMQINADMVVLSACKTGLGEIIGGEGIKSLARAFSYAGAKSVVTTIWSVNDQMSSKLMIEFYKNLDQAKTKDQALAEAKLSFLDNAIEADPFYWAGYIAIGDMSSLKSKPFNWAWLGLLIVPFIFVMLFWRRQQSIPYFAQGMPQTAA